MTKTERTFNVAQGTEATDMATLMRESKLAVMDRVKVDDVRVSRAISDTQGRWESLIVIRVEMTAELDGRFAGLEARWWLDGGVFKLFELAQEVES